MKLQNTIETKITENLNPAYLEIENESHMHSSGLGAESHFKVLVVSAAFEGLNRVRRQQKVYDLLMQELKNGIHALSLRLLTEDEWEKGGGEGFVSPNCQSKKVVR